MGASLKQKEKVKARRFKVLHGRVIRQTVREIAKDCGCDDSTIWNDLRELRKLGVDKDLIEQERRAHMKALPFATAVILAHILNGSLEASVALTKGVGVWSDKLEIIPKVTPEDQQKKLAERIKDLLKLEEMKILVKPENDGHNDSKGEIEENPEVTPSVTKYETTE